MPGVGGLKIILLFRGVHHGTYLSRNSEVRVRAHSERIHRNHEKMLIEPLRHLTSRVIIAVCTYESPVMGNFVKRKNATLVHTMAKSANETPPNELLLAAYDLVLTEKHFDFLVSVRADLMLKQPIDFSQHIRESSESLILPWREIGPQMPSQCFSGHLRKNALEIACAEKWSQNPRYGDAITIAPRHVVADLRSAIFDLLARHVLSNQHTILQYLIKKGHFDLQSNVSTLLLGYWDSNPSRHPNPLYSLARHKARAIGIKKKRLNIKYY